MPTKDKGADKKDQRCRQSDLPKGRRAGGITKDFASETTASTDLEREHSFLVSELVNLLTAAATENYDVCCAAEFCCLVGWIFKYAAT